MASFRESRGITTAPIAPPPAGAEGSATAATLVPVTLPAAMSHVATSRSLVRSLELVGIGGREAGNLVGLLHGLRPTSGGWTAHEIEHLRFLRLLVESGVIEH